MAKIFSITKEKWIALILSRRFQAAVIGVLAIAGNELLGLSEEDVTKVFGIVVVWILGDSYRETSLRIYDPLKKAA